MKITSTYCVWLFSDTEFTFTKAGEPGILVFNVPDLEDDVLVAPELMVRTYQINYLLDIIRLKTYYIYRVKLPNFQNMTKRST